MGFHYLRMVDVRLATIATQGINNSEATSVIHSHHLVLQVEV